MKQLLNTNTNTIHTASDKSHPKAAACGSLRYVSDDSIHTISPDELDTDDTVEHCGNCFEHTGGY